MPLIHLPQTNALKHRLLLLILVAFCFSNCDSNTGRSFKPSLPGYNDKQRKLYVLDGDLLEISGQVHIGKNQFAGINDEDGNIFIFHPDSGKVQKVRFSKKGDYEDIVKTDSLFYILESNGDIHEVQLANGSAVSSKQYKFEVEKKIEFESLVYYPSIHKLVLISKDHAMSKNAIVAYSFDLRTRQFDPQLFFEIPLNLVLQKLKDYSAQCKPSGAAIHPVTGKLFLLAPTGMCIIQCSPDGKVEFAYDLNPDQFQQPEGISFASNGDMYISNEGLQGKATMLLFPYQPGAKQ